MGETVPIPDPGKNTMRRYVTDPDAPDSPRYLRLLHANFLREPEDQRERFLQDLRRDARQASDDELTFLLQPGGLPHWRSRLTAAWLIGLAQRTDFRGIIADQLLASQVCYSGQGYCFALASFGTQHDADLLLTYLDRYLPQLDCRYDQPWAIGALLHLDARLNTHHADRLVAHAGPWEQWNARFSGHALDARTYQQLITRATSL